MKFWQRYRKSTSFFGLIIFSTVAFSQDIPEEKTNFTKRVLFILDGSGSMNERWQGESKWDMAVHTLSNLIDSFEQVNKDFEIGIRVLGHQYPKAMNRCDDTKLELDFSNDLNFQKVHQILKKIKPQGQTPLAYSIEQSEKDFSDDIKVQNIVVLITDGLENCNGNPCEVAARLREKNIFINPYIIGLGIDSLESQKLECIGKFIDAKNKTVFRDVIKTILTEVSLKTTLTISFIKSDSSLYPSYVPFSLIDKRTNKDVQNFIYTSNTKKALDTINVNPQYTYDLWIHTNPSFIFKDFKIIKGTHNHYIIPVLTGTIDYLNPDKTKKNVYFLRTASLDSTQWHPSIQPLHRLESNHVKIDLIQHPIRTIDKINIVEGSQFSLPALAKGTLIIKKDPAILASIYNQNWEKILTMDSDILNTYELIIGDYFILYNGKTDHSEKSKFQSFKIVEHQTTQLLIQ